MRFCEQRKWSARKTPGSKTGSLRIWLKRNLEISHCHVETHVWRSQRRVTDLVKTHLGSILFISTRVTVVVASKEKGLAQDLVHTALTGSCCHLRNVKIISWIGHNEKLMDFKGEREVIFCPTPKKMVPLVNTEDIKESAFSP